jgi:hypothetical protein
MTTYGTYAISNPSRHRVYLIQRLGHGCDIYRWRSLVLVAEAGMGRGGMAVQLPGRLAVLRRVGPRMQRRILDVSSLVLVAGMHAFCPV